MRSRSRAYATAVVFACAAFAACVGLTLSTTEQNATVVMPGSADFGTVQVGASSAAMSFVIAPAGSGSSSDIINSITGCSGFAISAPGVPGAQVSRTCSGGSGTGTGVEPAGDCSDAEVKTYTFTAQFVPVVAGFRSCNVAIATSSGSASLTLSGTGMLPPQRIAVSPVNVSFGDVRTGTPSSSANIGITNTGGSTLTVSSVAVTTNPNGAFAIVSGTTGSHAVAAGASETISVRCTPPMTTPFNGVLTISSNDTSSPNVAVALACNGINSNLDVQPTAFPPLDTRVFEAVTSTVQIKNVGTAAGTINSITLTAAQPGLTIMSKPNDNTPLGVNQSVPVVLRYEPAAAFDADKLGELSILFDGMPRTVAISGEAVLAQVASEPMQVTFGPVCLGSPPAKPLDIYAELAGSFRVTGATASTPFSVTPTFNLPATATPARGNDLRLMVGFAPTATGSAAGTITVMTDAPMAMSYQVPATATVLPDGVTALPEQLDFGAVATDTFTSALTATFTNCSADPIAITGETIEGDAAADFALVLPFTNPIPVATAETVEVLVQMAPRTTGTKQARLVIAHTGGTPTEVELTGAAFEPVDPAADRRETYYACTAGGDHAGWLIAGVLVLVCFRGRRRPLRG